MLKGKPRTSEPSTPRARKRPHPDLLPPPTTRLRSRKRNDGRWGQWLRPVGHKHILTDCSKDGYYEADRRPSLLFDYQQIRLMTFGFAAAGAGACALDVGQPLPGVAYAASSSVGDTLAAGESLGATTVAFVASMLRFLGTMQSTT